MSQSATASTVACVRSLFYLISILRWQHCLIYLLFLLTVEYMAKSDEPAMIRAIRLVGECHIVLSAQTHQFSSYKLRIYRRA